jgi:hypothetical protein
MPQLNKCEIYYKINNNTDAVLLTFLYFMRHEPNWVAPSRNNDESEK